MQAPNMGSYLNEAHVRQSDYRKAFRGGHFTGLLEIKRRNDPLGVFWCPICVGADDWVVGAGGSLCPK